MKCKFCGKELSGNEEFCADCGNKVSNNKDVKAFIIVVSISFLSFVMFY